MNSYCRAAAWRWLQLALSSLNWALIGAIVWMLLPKELSYGTVLATLLSAAIVGAADARAGRARRDRGGVHRRRRLAGAAAPADRRRCSPIARCTTWRRCMVAAAMHFTLEAIARRRKKHGGAAKA